MGIKKILTTDVSELFKSKEELFTKALRYDDQKLAREYIKEGINLDFEMEGYKSPLIYCCRHNEELALYMIKSGANIKLKSSDTGNSAILTATRYGRFELIKSLLENGEDINVENWQKMGNERISFTGVYPEQKLKLVEIYNFASRERMTISEDLETNIKTSPIITSFNELAQPAIEIALDNFEKKGGKTDRDFVLHQNRILKKQTQSKKIS